MPAGAPGIRSGLQPVGRGDAGNQVPGPLFHVRHEDRGKIRFASQNALEGADIHGVEIHIGHHKPGLARAGCEGQGGVQQIGPTAAAHVPFRLKGKAAAEGPNLGAGQEVGGTFQPRGPGHVHAEGLARLRLVHGQRAQPEEGHAAIGQQLRPLVAIAQGAVFELEPPAQA